MNNQMRYLKNKSHRTTASANQCGMGMIEVLVAVLVLAIGLLGLAALQVSAMQFTTTAQARSQATLLAHDVIERMRANRINVAGYNSALPQNPGACDVALDPGNSNAPADDLEEWRNHLACLLPLGNGAIEVAGNQVTVTVEWVEDRNDPDNPASLSFTAGI